MITGLACKLGIHDFKYIDQDKPYPKRYCNNCRKLQECVYDMYSGDTIYKDVIVLDISK